MSKHTPGPWRAEWGTREGYGCNGVKGWHVCGPDEADPPVCVIPDDDPLHGSREANAHLIAAAPDLLAACEGLLEAIENFRRGSEWYDRARKGRKINADDESMALEYFSMVDASEKQARAAIAKAKGED